jgi:hypothetical protein
LPDADRQQRGDTRHFLLFWREAVASPRVGGCGPGPRLEQDDARRNANGFPAPIVEIRGRGGGFDVNIHRRPAQSAVKNHSTHADNTTFSLCKMAMKTEAGNLDKLQQLIC